MSFDALYNIPADFFITPMRELSMPEITYFYVTNQPTSFANLERNLDPLLESLYQAKTQAGLAQVGPDITRYYKVDPAQDLYRMEVGIPVLPGTPPAGEAQVKNLPPYRCAGVMLWGSLAHVGQAYEALMGAMKEKGLQHSGEVREWNYAFEAPDSPNNIMGIYMEIG
jgi:effector-binding domain-containing protein